MQKLDIDFHDSFMFEVKIEKDVLVFIIDIDTYWFHGKPFGILKLKQPNKKEAKELVRFFNELATKSIDSIKIEKLPKGYIFKMQFIESSKEKKVNFKSFSFKRTDKCKKYVHGTYA